jgi:putative ATP-dependent endonuclease of the OLD family
MRIKRVKIENFRGIRALEIDLRPTTVFVGENNTGKTTVLDAMKICLKDLGPRRRVVFDSFDFHLPDSEAEPSSASPIQIELAFSEDEEGDWEKSLVGRLNRLKVLQVDDAGRGHVRLRVKCSYDPVSRDFAQDWEFLNLDGEALASVPDSALGVLQREASFFYLTALRDAARHFDARGPFWRPFLRDSQLSKEKKDEIEQRLKEVNELVVGSHESFEQARSRLKKVQDVVPMSGGDVVSIEAVPAKMFDMLSRAQIHLGASNGAKVPVGRHGEGTQSLAVLMLFSAFLDTWKEGTPVVALEEPEAHLHPSAVRALWDALDVIEGQKLISTHSGDLLSEVDIYDLVRLARREGEIRSYRLPEGTFDANETRMLGFHIRRTRGELLFARAWLLVEGETEAWIYPAVARAMGVNLHRQGVRIIEYSQSDVGVFAKVANFLGIPWYCVIDDDSGRPKYEPKAIDHLAGAPQADRIALPYPNMEVHLLANGHEGVYQGLMPTQAMQKITIQPGAPGYWDQFAAAFPARKKTRAAVLAAANIESAGIGATTAELRSVVESVVRLAE